MHPATLARLTRRRSEAHYSRTERRRGASHRSRARRMARAEHRARRQCWRAYLATLNPSPEN